jgi:hypothetical protein
MKIYPDQGIDEMLSIFPQNGTNLANLYVGLFTSQTPTTVPDRSAAGGASPSGFTEMVAGAGSYARIAIPSSSWGSPVTTGTGRKVTATQVNFTGFTSAAPANGFFIATQSASGAGDKIIFFANFDDGLSYSLVTTADQLLLTPYLGHNG